MPGWRSTPTPWPAQAATVLERAAGAAGVATAPSVPGPETATGVRVWRRLAGTKPRLPADPGLAAWLGRTVATIAAIGLPARPEPHHGPPATTPALRELSDLAGIVAPDPVLCHRDINRRNILLTPDGPVLLDFDNAGAQSPWWELVHQAFLLSCYCLGPQEPDPTTIRTAVAAYRNSGGAVGPTDRTAFAGLAGGLLDWARHDPGRSARQLPLITGSLDRWSQLLR